MLRILLDLEGTAHLGSIDERGLAILQTKLFAGNLMFCLCPARRLLEFQRDVEVIESFAGRHFAGQIDKAAVAWQHFGQRGCACLDHLAVAQEAVGEGEVAEGREAVAVADAELALLRQLEVDVLIHLLDLEELWRDVTVGGDDAVATEVVVVGIVAEAAAVVHVCRRLTPFAQALVHPVPDAATYHAFALELNVVPVFLQVANGVAHGVGVFAEEERALLQVLVLVESDHVGQVGVHAAVHVCHFVHAFIVYEAVVELLDGLLACDEVLAAAAFVAHAPEDDAGVVTVAQHHANLTVHVLRLPLRVAAKAVIAMALHVGLVHHVDAVVVVECIHARVVGIVARADRVEVVAFHQEDVLDHAFHGDGLAVDGVRVMSVGALEHHALAVDEHLSAAVLYLAEAVLLRIDVAAHADVDGVEIGRLGRPQLWVLHFEVELCVLLAGLYAADLQYGCLDGLACGVDQLNVHTGICLFAEVLEGNVDAEEGTTEVVATAAASASAHH